MRLASLIGVSIGLGVFGAIGPAMAKEAGPAGEWASKDGAPAWVTAPPARADAIRVVIGSQSNLLELADHADAGYVKRQVAGEAAWRLRGLLAEEADAILALPWPQPTLVQKGYHLTPAGPGETFPGAATYTVWTLFEVPAAVVLESLPAAKRESARAALALVEPSDTPAWEELKAAPPWSAKPVVAADAHPVVLRFSANRADVAKAQLSTLAALHVASKIVAPLRAPLGGTEAWNVGSVAATWRRCTARAVVTTRGETTAWALFEVPVARIVAAAPEAKRDAVRAIFGPKPAPK